MLQVRNETLPARQPPVRADPDQDVAVGSRRRAHIAPGARSARILAACARYLPMLALLAAALPARSVLIEETLQVPVRFEQPGQSGARQNVFLTVVRDSARARAPFALVLHGRPAAASGFAAMGQQKYPANSRFLAGLGFVVLIPTRIGYGVTAGPDLEFTGTCENKDYARGLRAVLGQMRQILDYGRTLPYVDPARGIVLGESFGGAAAIASASSDLPGVVGAVNVAGGDGGDLHHLDEPCRPDQLRETFAGYGRTNRLPTLWLYSRNDRFWGPRYPGTWFDAFVQAGGRGEFVSLPEDRNNGHYVFTRNLAAWSGPFERFVRALGFAAPGPKADASAPPRPGAAQ